MPSTNRQRHRSLSSSHRYRLRSQSQRRHILNNNNTINQTTISNEIQQQQQRITRCLRSELEAEDNLFQDIETLINRFLTCPGRRYPYHTSIRWTTNPQLIPQYSILIKIDQPPPTPTND